VRRGEQPILGPASPEPQPATADPLFLWKNVALSFVALSRANGAASRTLKKPEYQIGQTIAVLGEMRVDEVTAQNVLRLVRPIAPYRRGHSGRDRLVPRRLAHAPDGRLSAPARSLARVPFDSRKLAAQVQRAGFLV
jgi:hypothetical protein